VWIRIAMSATLGGTSDLCVLVLQIYPDRRRRDIESMGRDVSLLGMRSQDGLAQLLDISPLSVDVLWNHCWHRSPDGRVLFAGQFPGWIEGSTL